MASRDLVTFESGKYKRRVSSQETLDFLSIKVGESGLEIKESSAAFDFSAKKLTDIANAVADTDAPGWGQVKTYVDMGADSIVEVRFNTGQTKSLLLKYANLEKINR